MLEVTPVEKITDTPARYNPNIAIRRSALVPGWGQATNKKYWKIPIVYGALGTTTYVFFRNLKQYRESKEAYILATDGDESNDILIKQPYFTVKDQPERIRAFRNEVRQNLDYSVLFFIVFWGLNVVDAAVDAVRGAERFRGRPVAVRAIAVLYTNRMQVVTTEASGVKTMEDLKGKRISTGAPGSATEVMAFRVIEAAGLDKDKDLTRERLGVAESVNAIKDKKIDAFFWVGGIPTAAVTDLAATPGVKMKMIDHAEVVDAMNKKYGPLYSKATIAQTAYPGMDKPAQIADVWNVLVVRADMDEKLAYAIVKTMFDKQADLIAVHKEAASVKLDTQTNANTPIPFHPGAVKYYAEKGVKQ